MSSQHPSWSDAARGLDPLGPKSQKVYAHFAEAYADTQGDVAAMRAMAREIARLELALRNERSQGWDPDEPYLPLSRSREFS